jgi:hypothetical protein
MRPTKRDHERLGRIWDAVFIAKYMVDRDKAVSEADAAVHMAMEPGPESKPLPSRPPPGESGAQPPQPSRWTASEESDSGRVLK